jgi:hypothetical protein
MDNYPLIEPDGSGATWVPDHPTEEGALAWFRTDDLGSNNRVLTLMEYRGGGQWVTLTLDEDDGDPGDEQEQSPADNWDDLQDLRAAR